MGSFYAKVAKLFGGFSSGRETRILMLGLDAAGKTTLLYKTKFSETIKSLPTVGFNVETVTICKGVTFTVWDVGGQDRIRSLWRHYFQNVDGLLFIVDSADHARIDEAREELFDILASDEMRGVPVVVMANKQDLPGALKPSVVVDRLHLTRLQNRKWHFQGTCAPTAEGLYEGLEKLATLVKQFRKSRHH